MGRGCSARRVDVRRHAAAAGPPDEDHGVSSDRRVFAITAGLLAVAIVARSWWVGDGLDFSFNIALIALLLLWARLASMTAAELGVHPGDVAAGLRWGLATFAVVTVVLVAAALA